jgi:hypothetical protein
MIVEWEGMVMGAAVRHCSKSTPRAARPSSVGVRAFGRP